MLNQDLTLRKQQLRHALLPLMRQAAQRARPSSALTLRRLADDLIREFDFVVSLQSLPDEPDCSLLNRALFDAGRLVWIDWSGPVLQLILAEGPSRSGRWQTPPAGTPIEPSSRGAILVPSVAISPEGWRLGRGSGAYDRALEQFPALISIGIGWQSLAIDAVPVQGWDRPVSRKLLVPDHTRSPR